MRWVSLQGCCDLSSATALHSVPVLLCKRGWFSKHHVLASLCPSGGLSLSSVSSIRKRSWLLACLHLLLPQEPLHPCVAVFSLLEQAWVLLSCLLHCHRTEAFLVLSKVRTFRGLDCHDVEPVPWRFQWHWNVIHPKSSVSAFLGRSHCPLTDMAGAVCTILQIYSAVRPSGCGADS